jgi:MYXO-CTERM domain-containing protein
VRSFRQITGLSSLFAVLLSASVAGAFPGFMAGKKSAPVVHETHIVMLKKGNVTAVTVMPDYQGSLEPFALVLAVPADVTADRVVTLKREFVDHADTLSAPRFHEFWEQDPCDPGPAEQEWQRNLKVTGTGFLGGPDPTQGAQRKVAAELSLDVQSKTKEGEYKLNVLPAGSSPLEWLKSRGYMPPPGAAEAVAPYVSQGLAFVVAEVDTRRIELVGGDRAQLSPIRFATEQAYDTLPVRLGLLNASKDKQELFVYSFDADNRYEIANYKNVNAPTNIEVDFAVKERMGEFYNSLYDTILAKDAKTVLKEYAWPADGCGQPCATEPMALSELLSLGGDAFERTLPEAERNPKPPELTKEEKEAEKELLKPLKPKERRTKQKELAEDRKRIAQVKALVERHKYLLSRLHYRYDDKSLSEDPKLVAVKGGLEGGIALPKGQKREASTEVKEASDSKYQTRYNNFHNWKPVIQCPNPDRWKWGKSPPDYRGLRKIWVAEDLTRKSRTQIQAAKVVITEIPSLGLGASAVKPDVDAGADASADAGTVDQPSKGCGCRTAGAGEPRSLAFAGFSLVLAALGLRRRRSE